MPDDIAALIGLRAEMQKLIAQIEDRRTPNKLRRPMTKAIGALAIKVCDTALATLRAKETAPVGDDLV